MPHACAANDGRNSIETNLMWSIFNGQRLGRRNNGTPLDALYHVSRGWGRMPAVEAPWMKQPGRFSFKKNFCSSPR